MKILLVGSGRFHEWFHAWEDALNRSGHDAVYVDPPFLVREEEYAKLLLECDAIFVLNVMAYIGDDTLKVIFKASTGLFGHKKMFALESWGEGKGISFAHVEAFQQAAKSFGVFNRGSPLTTTHICGFKGPWDLLPPFGEVRSGILSNLEALDARNGLVY